MLDGSSATDRPTAEGVTRTVALVALSGVVSHALARSTYPILLPAIEDELLANHQQAGLLTTVNFGAYMGAVALVTSISGRFELTRILRVGLATAAIGFVVLAVAGGFPSLATGQILAGVGSAGIWMTAPAIATASVAANRRGTVMGLLSSTMGIGIIASSQGTSLARALADDDRIWRPTWVGAALFAAAVLAAMTIWLRAPATASIAGGVSLDRLRAVPGWLTLTIGYVLSGLVVSSFTPFFGAAMEESGFSRGHVANLYSLFGLAAVFGAVSLGRLSDRVGRRPVLLGAMVAIAASCALVLTGREPYATVAAVLFGAASFTFPVLVAAYLSDHLKDRAFANGLGALTLIYGVALLTGPFVSGTVGDSTLGFEAVFVGLTACSLLAAVAIHAVPADGEAVTTAPAPST